MLRPYEKERTVRVLASRVKAYVGEELREFVRDSPEHGDAWHVMPVFSGSDGRDRALFWFEHTTRRDPKMTLIPLDEIEHEKEGGWPS